MINQLFVLFTMSCVNIPIEDIYRRDLPLLWGQYLIRCPLTDRQHLDSRWGRCASSMWCTATPKNIQFIKTVRTHPICICVYSLHTQNISAFSDLSKRSEYAECFSKWIFVAGVMKFHPQILHSCEENRRRTRQINASCCSCWRHGSIIKYFSRANLRMLRLLPRPPIRRLNFFSRPTSNKIPLFSIHQSEGPWPCEENQRQDQK